MEKQTEKSIALKITPPFYYLAGLLLGLALHLWIAPIDILSESKIDTQLGLLIAVLGVILFIWSTRTMARYGVDPRFKPVRNIVTRGPFGFSRNPIYISFALVYFGIAVMYNTLWPILFLPFVISLVHYRVIVREESYMHNVFGDEYKSYRSKVRRWF